MNCFVCNKTAEKSFAYEGPDPYKEVLDKERFWYKCASCGAFSGELVPDIEEFYSKNYYDIQLSDVSGIRGRFEKIMNLPPDSSDNVQRVKRVMGEYLKWISLLGIDSSGKTLLDIGTGYGVFPAKLNEFSADLPWDVSVIEPGAVACEFLKELEFNTYEGCFGDLELKGEFSLITLNRVLEHVCDPVGLLKKLHENLNSESFVYIEVPDAMTFELYGQSDDQFASTHYVIYSPEALMHALNCSGFECLTMQRVKEPSGKITLYTFVRIKR